MNLCPQCYEVFDTGYDRCPDDGAQLVLDGNHHPSNWVHEFDSFDNTPAHTTATWRWHLGKPMIYAPSEGFSWTYLWCALAIVALTVIKAVLK